MAKKKAKPAKRRVVAKRRTPKGIGHIVCGIWDDKQGRMTLRKVPLFKVLEKDGTAPFAMSDCWKSRLPKGNRRGKWLSVRGELRMCSNGLHLTPNLARWTHRLDRVYLWLAEYRGDTLGIPDQAWHAMPTKICCRHARLVRRITWTEARKLARGAAVKTGK